MISHGPRPGPNRPLIPLEFPWPSLSSLVIVGPAAKVSANLARGLPEPSALFIPLANKTANILVRKVYYANKRRSGPCRRLLHDPGRIWA